MHLIIVMNSTGCW